MKYISIVGARPNFMKIAPIYREFIRDRNKIAHMICHTGQHFDDKMSNIFFCDLKLPKPDFYLGIGSGSHAEQTAKIMIKFEKVLIREKPDLIIVVGDVNSTLAASLVAAKMNIKIAHIEAGLRSFDRTMPEETNRIITDSVSDYLFVSERSGLENLKREGIDDEKIFFTGNIMIDNLIHYLPRTESSNILSKYGLIKKKFVVATIHRPSNVDSEDKLRKIIYFINKVATRRKIIFSIHPRTRLKIKTYNLERLFIQNVILTEPFGYIDFLALLKNAELVITDSGGIQEESTFLKIQCLTIRNNTERPATVEIGTNQVVGADFEKTERFAYDVLNGKHKKGKIPELWDGKTAKRIAKILIESI